MPGIDHQVLEHHGGHDVLVVRGRERHLPEEPAVGGREPDDVRARLRDDLPGAGKSANHRRRIARTVALPLPAHRAGGRIERAQRAALVAADMSDHQPVVDERRHRGAEVRRRGVELSGEWLAPERLASRGVEGRERAVDPQREDAAAAGRRRRLRPLPVTLSRGLTW